MSSLKLKKIRIAFLLAGLFVSLGASLVLPAQGQEKLSSDQRKELRSLLSAFKRSGDEPAARLEAFDQLLAFDNHGIDALEPVIEKKLNAAVETYLRKFGRSAGAVVRAQTRDLDQNRVLRLQQQVLRLSEDPGLSKNRIVNEGDPALAELREMLLVPASKVLEDEQVNEARQLLAPMGLERDRLREKKRELATDAANPEVVFLLFEQELSDAEELIMQMAIPSAQQNQAVFARNRQLAGQIKPEEFRCINECNLMRNLIGLNVLQIDVNLCLTSRDHSNDMETHKFFAHDSPLAGKAKPWDRAKLFGTTANAENIQVGARTGERANFAWFHSPGHHKNMFKATHRRIGVGQHNRHWTELFGR